MEDFGAPGGKDLFSPMQLECMFRPPSIGPGGGSPLGLPQPQKQQMPQPIRLLPEERQQQQVPARKQDPEQPQRTRTPIPKYRSSLPLPTSSPRPLAPVLKEDHRLQPSPSHLRRKSTTALTTLVPPRQISKLRQSIGHRKSSSGSSIPPAAISSPQPSAAKGSRHIDVDDTRSVIVPPDSESTPFGQSTLLSDNLRANERWSSIRIGHGHVHGILGNELGRNGSISSIIGDRLKLLKEPVTRENSSPGIGSTLAHYESQNSSPVAGGSEEDDSEANDTVPDLPSAGPRERRRQSLVLEGESSIYPSSPPVLGYNSQIEDTGYLDGSDDYDASYLDDSGDDLGSLFTSPNKRLALEDSPQQLPQQNPMLASPFLPAGQEPPSASPSKKPAPMPPQGEMAGVGNSILDNIRRHKDAPKSPMKSQHPHVNRRDSLSPDEREDPFFTPHAFRHQISNDPRAPPTKAGEMSRVEIQDTRNSGSPLKLFASFYDTYTNERLTKRLGELEVSVLEHTHTHMHSTHALQVPAKERGESESEQETDVSFSGGSAIVNRLEKLARKAEKAKSPSRRLGSASTARPVSAHRHTSAPEASPSRGLADGYRKHRRWRSDETAVGDGIETPPSPLKERTPKRIRRNTGGGYHHVPRVESPPPPVPEVRYLSRAQSDTTTAEAPMTPARRRVTGGTTPVSVGKGSIGRKGRKVPVLKRNYDYGGSIKLSPQQPKTSPLKRGETPVFNGCKGDGMKGEGFEMPSPVQSETVRKGSVTTQDFLDQADAVMNRIRGRGIRGCTSEDDSSYYDEGSIMTSPGRGTSVIASSPLRNEVERCLPRIQIATMGNTREIGSSDTVKTQASTGSHRSRSSAVEVISPHDGVMGHHLVQKNTGEMTFDRDKMAWVKRDRSRSRSASPEKEESLLLKIDDSDPFVGISDLSVDSQEEARALELARKNWEGMASDGEKSGLWRSSRMMPTDEEDEDGHIGDETWDRHNWFGEATRVEGERDPSTVGSGSERSGRSTRPGSGAETRTTSYGSEDNKGKVVDKQEDDDDDDELEVSRAEVKSSEPLRRTRNSYAEDYSSPNSVGVLGQTAPSSPVDLPVLWSDDGDTDGGIDGFLDHGSLRQPRRSTSRTFSTGGTYRGAARRRSSGAKNFVGRPISRITEEEEEDNLPLSAAMQDIQRELSRISLGGGALTPLRSPFLSGVSMATSMELSTNSKALRDRRDSSFQLAPLADLSYQFETTETLINLELSFFATRPGRSSAGTRAVEESFSIARDNLLKCLTDVEPYEPYWDHMKVLNLAGRKVETLFTLNDWMPRVEELDVSNNELGQLSGVSESVTDLKVMGNCLSGLTHWGHLVNLQYLDLSKNGLENLDGLRGLRHLREVRADDNVLDNIDGVLGMDGLGLLRARRNRLVEVRFENATMYVGILPLPLSFFRGVIRLMVLFRKRLTELDLRGNDIEIVSGIENLPSLINLNLDQNSLDSLNIPTGTRLDAIRCIKLTQNYFETFDVSQFPNLRILYMDNNRLGGIEGLTRAKNLDAISIREQEHDGRECTLKFERMYEARKIYLSGNPLRNLSFKLDFLNLQYLELASGQLTTLPKDFGYLVSNTRVLNLNNNAISDLRPLMGIVRLKKLLLVGNRVKSVKKIAAVLGYFPSLSFLDLR